jgi:hypothetical protein
MRAWKKYFLVGIASVWLAMTAHGHMHMTAMLASYATVEHHPALETNAHVIQAHASEIVVVDPALFWDAVDQFSSPGDTNLVCALHLPAIASVSSVRMAAPGRAVLNEVASSTFSSRCISPDTPPPRT